MKNICLLGATGSIGMQVLDLIEEFNSEYTLKCFSFGSNIDLARKIINKFNPSFVSCKNDNDKEVLKKEYPSIIFESGIKGLISVACYECDNPYVVNALVGSVGLIPSYETLNKKRDLYLANKESLVVGGSILCDIAAKNNVKIIPIDSEHSAIYQLLKGQSIKEVNRLLITASGGSFRDLSKEELKNVKKEDALNHPNWKMGEKITIDCATMMNKGFEIIEAHYLFNLPIDKITPIIHEQSIIHSCIEFNDHSIFAQMASSDMHLPIKYALFNDHSYSNNIKYLDLEDISSLTFRKVDYNRYPLVKYAYDVINKGGIYPCILNASNEAAVRLFLDDKITFLDIENIIFDSLNNPLFTKYENDELSIELLVNLDKLIKDTINNTYRKEF